MILSDKDIINELNSGNIIIEPITDSRINPASINLTLGDSYSVIDRNQGIIDASAKEIKYVTYTDFDSFILEPHQFALAATKEIVTLGNNISAMALGRSSIGRMGLFVENASWVDPGFSGTITLELYNATDVPIRITRGMEICQLVFLYNKSEAIDGYRGKYQGQILATGSRLHLDDKFQK